MIEIVRKLKAILEGCPRNLRGKHGELGLVPLVEFWEYHNETERQKKKLANLIQILEAETTEMKEKK